MDYVKPSAIFALKAAGNFVELRRLYREYVKDNLDVESTLYLTDVHKARDILEDASGNELLRGLEAIGFPQEDITSTVAELLTNNRIKGQVLDVIAQTCDEVGTIHPDKYPYSSSLPDIIHNGLHKAGVSTKEVLRDAQKYFKVKKGRDLPRTVETANATTGVVNLLELYALAQTLIKK